MGGSPVPRNFCFFGLAFFFLASGCNRQDTECLAHLGRKLAASAGGVLKSGLSTGWQGMYSGMSLEARVAARLRWDKGLAEAAIEVKASGNDIELKGNVRDQNQHQRALDLTQSTAGVDKVTDLLTVGSPPDLEGEDRTEKAPAKKSAE